MTVHMVQVGLYYRPHTKFGASLYFHRCVSHSVRGGGVLYDVTSCLAVWSHVPSGKGGLCAWSHVPSGGLCTGASLSGGVCPGGVCLCQADPPGTVKSGRYASYWNAFLLVYIFSKKVYVKCPHEFAHNIHPSLMLIRMKNKLKFKKNNLEIV